MFLISNGLYLILYRTHVMLVIHPKDRTTEMLSILYEGLEARLIESFTIRKIGSTDIKSIAIIFLFIFHTP